MGLKNFFSLFSSGPPRVDLWRRYERLRESHSGTMSHFYKVKDIRSGLVVGLKINDRQKSQLVENRYKGLERPSEGQIGATIQGPNIVKTIEWGISSDGESFIVQEFIEGTLLHALLATKKQLPPAQRLDLVRQAATAIAVVHKAGFVHRDICPRNFLLQSDGRLMLFDFGLSVPDKPIFLQPGNRTGTPNYMAPEIVRRKQADKTLDIFAFGVTAFEICALALPWPHGTTGSAAMLHDSTPVDIRTHWPDIPPPLAGAITACLAAEPGKRPPSMETFLRSISKVVL